MTHESSSNETSTYHLTLVKITVKVTVKADGLHYYECLSKVAPGGADESQLVTRRECTEFSLKFKVDQ